MSRTARKLKPVRGRRYRITRLDACGNLVYEDNASIVSNGVVTAAFSRLTNETEAVQQTNSNGDLVVDEPAVTKLAGYSVELTMAELDAEWFSAATGLKLSYDIRGIPNGIIADTDIDLEGFGFALEVWTGVAADGDACGEVGEQEFGYILLPFLKGGALGDFSVENGAISLVITGASSRKGGNWRRGPYNVEENAGGVAGPLLEPITSTQVLVLKRVNVSPPEALVGGRPLMNRTGPSLSGIAASVSGLEVDFSVTPPVGNGEGVYYEFGDGTWEYITDGGGAYTHTYDEEGTYLVTATANGAKYVTRNVAVEDGS